MLKNPIHQGNIQAKEFIRQSEKATAGELVISRFL